MSRRSSRSMRRSIARSIVRDAHFLAIPTDAPGLPTFVLIAEHKAIDLRITRGTGGRPAGYRYRLRRRNSADTAWESARPWVDVRNTRNTRIRNYSANQLIEGDRKYEVKVIAYNLIGDSPESAYKEVTPLANARPGLPTFTFAALRYEYDATGDEVSATVNFNPRPNGDGVGVTHWLFRYRESGTIDWTTQVVVAQPELDTVYGFRLDEDDIGDTYEVQVASRNSVADSAYTSIQTIVVSEPLLPAPTFTITYNPFAKNDALYFTCDPVAPVNPVLALTGYDIRYREFGTTAWATVGHSLDVLNIGYFVELADRFIGKQLEVQMRADNEYSGGIWSVSQRLQIIGVPDRPGLFLTAQEGGFDVRIVPPPSGDRAVNNHFRYREGTSGDWTEGTSAQVRALKDNTLYQVEAWTSNPAGQSLSAFATVATLAAPARDTEYLIVYGDNLIVYGDDLIIYGE